MSQYIVETFYTCSIKIVNKIDELSEKKLSELENRNDGEVQIIDVKLNNRKTKTANKKENIRDSLNNLNEKSTPDISSIVNEKIVNSDQLQTPSKLDNNNIKTNKFHRKKIGLFAFFSPRSGRYEKNHEFFFFTTKKKKREHKCSNIKQLKPLFP